MGIPNLLAPLGLTLVDRVVEGAAAQMQDCLAQARHAKVPQKQLKRMWRLLVVHWRVLLSSQSRFLLRFTTTTTASVVALTRASR